MNWEPYVVVLMQEFPESESTFCWSQILVPFEVVIQQFFVLCRTLRVRNAHPPVADNNNSLCAIATAATTLTSIVHSTHQRILVFILQGYTQCVQTQPVVIVKTLLAQCVVHGTGMNKQTHQ